MTRGEIVVPIDNEWMSDRNKEHLISGVIFDIRQVRLLDGHALMSFNVLGLVHGAIAP